MNRFYKLGLIEYDGRIRVRRALLNAILQDRLPGDNAIKPAIGDFSQGETKSAKLAIPINRFNL